MSLALENKVKALEKQLKKQKYEFEASLTLFKKQLDQVVTDKQMITDVLYITMENYLRDNVEFSLSVEGRIREIIKP